MLNTQYKVHDTSWGKFLGFILGVGAFTLSITSNPANYEEETHQDGSVKKVLNKTAQQKVGLINNLLGSIYFISNLYDQYKYNKSLEYSFDIEINGEVKTINASPQEWDSYTIYNSLFLGGSLLSCTASLFSSPTLKSVADLTATAGFLTWAGRACFSSDYNDFNFKDSEGNRYTAEEIHHYLIENDSAL